MAKEEFKNTKVYKYGKTFIHYRRPISAKFLKEVPRGSLILDLGCGIGYWSQYLEDDLGFNNVVGIDISKDSVSISNENKHKLNLNTDFIVGDVRRLPFKNNTFSGLFSSDVLGHIIEVDQVIKEVSRVLKSGGTAAILTETNGYIGKNTYQNYVISIVGEDPWILADGHIGLKSYKELKELIENAGLKIADAKFFPYNHLFFSLLYPEEYDYKMLVDRYPDLNKSMFLKIIHLSAVMRKRIFIYKVLCHVLSKIFGTMFIYLNRNTDYGGIFFKLKK